MNVLLFRVSFCTSRPPSQARLLSVAPPAVQVLVVGIKYSYNEDTRMARTCQWFLGARVTVLVKSISWLLQSWRRLPRYACLSIDSHTLSEGSNVVNV